MLLCFAGQAASAATPHIESFRLSNGMRAVLVESHRVPAVYHSIWLPVGAADDPPGKSGLAHFMEHMMFQGSDHLAPGEFSKRVAELGGQQNASTGRDYTVYHVSAAKEHLEEVMRLEAERFAHMNPPEENFAKEREVILEERRMRVDNDPQARMAEQLDAALFLHHPYRIPVIGWKHEMEALTRADTLAFHQAHYHAGNMLLLVAGDITRAELEPLAEKYYGGFPARAPSAHNWPEEPERRAERRAVLRDPQAAQPVFSRSYLAPGAVHGDARLSPPLLVAEQLLGGEGTGWLYRELVAGRKLASTVAAEYEAFSVGPGRFTLYATPADGVTPEALERAIDETLAAFLAAAPDESAIARAKTVLKAEALYAQDSLDGLGSFIGTLYMLGLGEDYFLNWEREVDGVTPERITQAARAVFVPGRSATAWLLPEEKK